MTPSLVAAVPAVAALLAASERVQHRITSGLVEGFSQWWQMPALVLALAALVAFVLWMYRRDAVELPRGMGIVLAALRLGAIAALVAAYLDLERRAEHEIPPAEVADAHHRYAIERDALVPSDHTGPRPSGGVAGTRTGVKCLHAHYAWHLAGGDDPVGRWVANELAAPTTRAADATPGTLAPT